MDQEKVTNQYDESSIQVLEGLEAVRKRPGMYIGSTSIRGLHHLVYEIVDNSIDEALAGYCDTIQVSILPGNIIEVVDNGRGIPVGIHPKMGIPTVEVVFTILHAGGKFGGGGYKVSGGLHGVGASVVNALSQWLEVEVHSGGEIYYQKYERGHSQGALKKIGTTDRTGTTVRFLADDTIFETLEYEFEVLQKRLREQAFLNAGLRIDFEDKREGKEKKKSMCYEGGIREFVTYLNRAKEPIHEEVIYVSGMKGTSMAEIAMQYTTKYDETMVSFANDINTTEGGSFADGLRSVLRLDPDVVMVGEIRDTDTARTAIQASITGHLVLSSFHANSTSAAFSRMIDMIGTNPIFSSSVRLIIAQRLVRKLADNKEAYQPDEATMKYINRVFEGVSPEVLKEYGVDLDNVTLYKPVPSPEVPFGYKGRDVIMEQLIVTEDIQAFIRGDVKDINTNAIESAAKQNGMLTLEQKGVIAALRGQTTLDEVARVI